MPDDPRTNPQPGHRLPTPRRPQAPTEAELGVRGVAYVLRHHRMREGDLNRAQSTLTVPDSVSLSVECVPVESRLLQLERCRCHTLWHRLDLDLVSDESNTGRLSAYAGGRCWSVRTYYMGHRVWRLCEAPSHAVHQRAQCGESEGMS
jgi:hypothetical protein